MEAINVSPPALAELHAWNLTTRSSHPNIELTLSLLTFDLPLAASKLSTAEQLAGSAFMIIGLLVLAGIYIGSLAWLFRDANQRNRNGAALVVVVALFAYPVGLLIWYLARPSLSPEKTSLRLWDGSFVCRKCGTRLIDDDKECPECGTAI